MRFFRSDTETSMASYILDELRELRKGQEGNNVEIRGEFAAIRDTITTLSEGVKVTQNQSVDMRSDLDKVARRVADVEDNVHQILRSTAIKEASQSSSWDGPKRIMVIVAGISTLFASFIAVAKGWPLLVNFLSSTIS